MGSAEGSSGRVVVIGVLVLMLGGLGILTYELATNNGQQGSACSAPFAEQIDPLSSQHLLPGAAEPAFSTNPPTSGAHKPGVRPTGALRESIERPVQVNLLEQGDVLIQYNQVTSSVRAKLDSLAQAGNQVTVAPNHTLSSKRPIVATAWLYKLECARLDRRDLQTFIDDHVQKAPVQ